MLLQKLDERAALVHYLDGLLEHGALCRRELCERGLHALPFASEREREQPRELVATERRRALHVRAAAALRIDVRRFEQEHSESERNRRRFRLQWIGSELHPARVALGQR